MTLTPPDVGTPGSETRRSYVRSMFTAIAPRYDLLNHLLSLNVDRGWRRRAIARLGWQAAPQGTYLDLCAGTLDLATELAGQAGFGGTVVGADFVVPMLRLGMGKAESLRPVGADALELPFPDAAFDGCTIGFGIRNLVDIGAGVGEMARVLKPGARLVILEFSTPAAGPLRSLYLFYFRHVLPRVGRMVSGHATAYTYLPGSVEEFAEPAELRATMERHGFDDVRQEPLTFGIATLHWGSRR
jgi:demethylmenaquinone methyltransferase/2-methoxy-6-polyprenyl-1,4-benzoquinol methylase